MTYYVDSARLLPGTVTRQSDEPFPRNHPNLLTKPWPTKNCGPASPLRPCWRRSPLRRRCRVVIELRVGIAAQMNHHLTEGEHDEPMVVGGSKRSARRRALGACGRRTGRPAGSAGPPSG